MAYYQSVSLLGPATGEFGSLHQHLDPPCIHSQERLKELPQTKYFVPSLQTAETSKDCNQWTVKLHKTNQFTLNAPSWERLEREKLTSCVQAKLLSAGIDRLHTTTTSLLRCRLYKPHTTLSLGVVCGCPESSRVTSQHMSANLTTGCPMTWISQKAGSKKKQMSFKKPRRNVQINVLCQQIHPPEAAAPSAMISFVHLTHLSAESDNSFRPASVHFRW